MRSASASQSAWVTARAATRSGPYTSRSAEYRCGHGLQGLGAVGVVVLPAGLVAQLLAGGDLAGPETVEGAARSMGSA